MSDKRAIVVTGGSRGIGAAVCTTLAAAGYPILVNYRSDRAAAAHVVDAIKATGGIAVAIQADVSDAAQIEALFADADRELGPLGGLVNNAGVVGDLRRLDDHDAASLSAVFATNVIGAMLCAKEAVRRLSTKHGGAGGSIVNIGSIAGTNGGITGMLAYAASKGAIATFTLSLAKEVAREGIRVNAVSPGMIVTNLTQGYAEQVGPSVPLGRCGEPHEIAEAVAWLMSDKASYAIGTVLTISGGR